MEHLDPTLLEDYERWKATIGDDPYTGSKTVGILDVLRAHYLIVDFFAKEYGEGIGGIGPKSIGLLHSTLSRQFSSFGDYVKWSDDYTVCATLFWGLVKNHAFHDVNKRTAFLTLLYHLKKVGKFPTAKQRDYERLAIRIAANDLSLYKEFSRYQQNSDGEVLFVANFLRNSTRRINRSEFMITYRQLDTALKKHHYGLVNPDGNQIDLVRFEEEKIGFFKKETRRKEKRLQSIGFPGWNRQVNVDAIKKIRKLTGLTVENGVDSDAFFHGADSLPSLIDQFQGPLKRLADK